MPDQKDVDKSIAAAEEEQARLETKRAEVIARLQDLQREKILLAQLDQYCLALSSFNIRLD